MTIRVLSIDGGGMRGLYTATCLHNLEALFRKQRKENAPLDIGKAFDLITGTSTGAIIACALACGLEPIKIANLYEEHASAIFPRPVPPGLGRELIWQLMRRPRMIEAGEKALRNALSETFQDTTLGDVYTHRNIALSIPAINMLDYKMWVFKTAHCKGTRGLDDQMSLVDACMASTAAPVYRSLAYVPARGDNHMFADGGLAANNPTLIALVDALDLASQREGANGTDIEIYSIGTCAPAEGAAITESERHRGLAEWRFGGKAVEIALTAQTKATQSIADLLVKHFPNVSIIKFPDPPVSAENLKFLQMDEASPKGLSIMKKLAAEPRNKIAERLSRRDPHDKDINRIEALFTSMPTLTPIAKQPGGMNG